MTTTLATSEIQKQNNTYKGFFVKRLALICQISNFKKKHLSDFFNSFQQVAKIQKDSLKKLHLYMVYSQIWRAILMNGTIYQWVFF